MTWWDHANTLAHWLPQPAGASTITACGLDVDGPCDNHRGEEGCRYGLAFTRSDDLLAFVRSRDVELLVCVTCGKAAREHADAG